jgi:outer membrane protein assembly factor BamB
VALDAATGAVRWRREVPGGLAVQGLRPAPGARVALLAPGRIDALELSTGRPAWSVEAPGALRLHALRAGPLLVVAADTGLVQALDAGGRSEWRLRGAGPLSQRPALAGGRCLLLFRTPLGATLAAVDAARGQRAYETALDLVPTGPPVAFAGRVAVAGSVGGDPVVAALEPDGSPAWSGASSPAPGPVARAPLPGGLALKTADGSCAALDRDGMVRWTRSRDGASPAPGNLPPVATRGLLLVPSDAVEVLDEGSGRPVGHLPVPTPARIHVGEDLRVVGVDADGLAWAARLRTHLSLVR